MNVEDLYTVEKHEAGAEMQVRDENGKLLDMYITMAGVDSKRLKNAFKEAKRKIMDGSNVDSDDLSIDAFADSTIGWRGFQSKGKNIKFSKSKIRQLYKNAPYIIKQLDDFSSERANFTKG